MDRFFRRATRAVLMLVAVSLAAPAAQATSRSDGPVPVLDDSLDDALNADKPAIEVVVQFATPPTDADVEWLKQAGFGGPLRRFDIVPAVFAIGSADAVRSLTRNSRVVHVEENEALEYHLDRATAASRTEPVWTASYSLGGTLNTGGFTGRGVGIGIVDSGVDGRHPDLLHHSVAGATGKQTKTVKNLEMVPGFSFLDVDYVDIAHTDQTGGHGTHVAGIAAGTGAAGGGKYRGAAPGADVYGFGAGEGINMLHALAAFEWIHDNVRRHNIRVINNSWGIPGGGEHDPKSSVAKSASRLVNQHGIVVVWSAGNSGGDGSTVKTNSYSNNPDVISVANYYDRTGWVDTSSSRGLKTKPETWPALAAPGTQIISAAAAGGPITYFGTAQDALINQLGGGHEPTVVSAPTGGVTGTQVDGNEVLVGDYASFTGTSMAAPLVAGVVALLLEANPALTPAQVKDVLRASATMPAGLSYETHGYAIGKGVVDAAEAIAIALRMREGDTLAEAVANASVDFTATPVTINSGPGPVTDQTIPLAPALKVRTVEGDPLLFQGGALSIGGASTVVRGEPVSFEAGGLRSNDPAVVVTDDGYTGRMELWNDGVKHYDLVVRANRHSSRGLRIIGDWNVPVSGPTGDWQMRAFVTIAGVEYDVADMDFTVA